MKVVILHLSDIHFKSEHDPVISLADNVAKATYEYLLPNSTLVIVISGDVAFSGKKEQYEIAELFLLNIEGCLKKEFEGLKIEYVICPGNHDCDFSENKELREFILGNLQNNDLSSLSDEIIGPCVSPQKEYVAFREKFESGHCEIDPLWASRTIEISGKSLLFDCVNLSWASEIHEQQGHLKFPFDRYKHKSKLKADLRFAVMHHPLNWLEQKSYRDFRLHLRTVSDFVITGHEHSNNIGSYEDIESGKSIIVEGGVLQEGDIHNSSFGIISIDMSTSEADYFLFKWNEASDCYKNIETRNLTGIECSGSQYLSLNESFYQKITDCGAYLSHPEKPKLELEDVFVFPSLKLNFDEEDKRTGISADCLKDPNFFDVGTILSGEDSAGKSSLIYTLYSEYLLRGYLPVLIDGSKLKSDQEKSINNIINRTLREQYEDSDIETKFSQSSRIQKVLFVDNFDASPLKSNSSKNNAIDRLSKKFSKIIISVDSSFEVGELVASDETPVLTDFSHFIVEPFGFMKRTELIHKWHAIGNSVSQSESEYIANCDAAEKIFDTVMDKSLIPANPLYLLTLLQSQNNQDSSELSDSAQGHYYGYLLTQSLLDIGIKKDKIGEELSFSKHLAWFFSQQKTNVISESEFKRFVSGYSDKWHSVDFEKKKETLLEARILVKDEDNYQFRYLYNYYYLKGKYLSDFLLTDDVQEEISNCIKHLYMKRHAHTILFLAHHSSSDNVLVYIKEAVEKLFSNRKAVEYNGESKALVELIRDAPKLETPKTAPIKNRLESSKVRDEKEKIEESLEIEQEQDPDNLTLIAKLNMLFKTTDILGQLLKAQYSKIERTKKAELIEQLFLAPLRSLQDFYLSIEQNPKSLIEAISQAMSKKSKLTEEASDKLARTVVSRIIQGVSSSFIARAAQAVNSDDLKEDVQDVVEKNGTLAFDLIDAAISLDSHRTLDKRKLKAVNERCKGNLVASKVLDMLIFKRLYMFKTTEKDMQWLSSELKYDIKSQHTITYQNKSKRFNK